MKCGKQRNSKGQFVFTTGAGRYKRKWSKEGNKQLHRVIYEKHYKVSIPDDCIIHHKDNDKFNNDKKNLQLMTYKEHNLIHAKDRSIWNEGLTTKTSEKWKNTIIKRDKIKKQNYLRKCIESLELYNQIQNQEITANLLDISTRQLYDGLKVARTEVV